jgi:hypothetical protein
VLIEIQVFLEVKILKDLMKSRTRSKCQKAVYLFRWAIQHFLMSFDAASHYFDADIILKTNAET